jgi:DNA invertase Pin-like site-specific DNA recombinase
MLTILGGLAEFERSLILARTADGVKRAKEHGVKFGRPTALTAYQRQEALKRLEAGRHPCSVRTAALSAVTTGSGGTSIVSGHRRLKIVAVQLEPEPHFVGCKSLL